MSLFTYTHLCSHMYVSLHLTRLFSYSHVYFHVYASLFKRTRLLSYTISSHTDASVFTYTRLFSHIHSPFAYKYLFSPVTFLSAYVRYLSALPYPTLNVSDHISFSLLYTFYFPTYTHLFSNIHVSFHICAVPECVPLYIYYAYSKIYSKRAAHM